MNPYATPLEPVLHITIATTKPVLSPNSKPLVTKYQATDKPRTPFVSYNTFPRLSKVGLQVCSFFSTQTKNYILVDHLLSLAVYPTQTGLYKNIIQNYITNRIKKFTQRKHKNRLTNND